MAKYSADIEIAVRGGQQVDGLIKNLNRLNNSINVVNRNAKLLEGKGFNVASMENYSRAVLKAENAIRKAAQGTQQEEQAVKALVTAMDAENKARARRNFLIAQEVANRRQVIATANAGVGMQGPQAAAVRAVRGPASPIRGTVNMPGSPAALAAAAGGGARNGRGISGRLGGAVSGSIIGGAFPLLFGQGGGAAAGGAIGGFVGGLAGPGGSFAGSLLGTLLGDIASRGQAVKQLAEDIGFSAQQTKQLSDAFKVANTDVEKFTAVIQNIRGLGLEIEDQAKAIQLVTRLTELYGGSFEKTGNAITSALEGGKVTQATLNQLTSQGINIQQALADKYKVNRDAILAMAKDGEISVQDLIDTLVKLGNDTDVGAKKQQNVFEAAYERISSAAAEAATAATSSFSQTGGELQQAASTIQSAFTSMFDELVRGTSEFILGLGEIARIAGSALDGVVAKFLDIQYGILDAANNLPVLDSGIIEFAKNALAVLNPVGALIDKIRGAGKNRPQQFGPEPPPVSRAQIESFKVPSQAGASGAAGPKAPENRTAALLADLKALTDIGDAQNLIRDLMFEGREIAAADAELAVKLHDIERDRVQQLEKANYQSEREVINKIAATRALNAQQEVSDKIRDINSKRFEDELRMREAVRDSVRVFTDIRKEQEAQAQYGKTYLRLVTEGMLPAEAERTANFEKLVKEQLSAVEEQIKLTDLAILEAKARGASTVELEKQLKLFKAQQDAIKGEAAKGPGEGKTNRERLQDEIAAVQGQLNELLDPVNQIKAAAAGIGSAFSESFKGVVSGAMTAQEALAGFFQSIADQFLDMAAQIIAKWIQLTILNSILRIFPVTPAAGGAAGLFGAGTPDAIAGGGIFSGAGPYQFKAKGGPVSAGSPYIVGEKGPELFVPGKSGTIVPNNKLGSSGSSNVVVNVDASGSKVQGDDTKASQLGSALAAAVQAEIIKQKKPGGLLY